MAEPRRTTIRLERPIDTGSAVVEEIVLRDPNLEDFMTLDEPWTYQETPGGKFLPVDHGPTIAMYLKACLVEPKNDLVVMSQCTVKDGMAIKEWLSRFFRAGVGVKPASTTSLPNSSTATAA